MNEYLKRIGLGLAGKVIDFGVNQFTGPRRPRVEQRLEQIDKTLKALESEPADAQSPARPPIEAPQSQNPGPLALDATITTQPAKTARKKGDVAIACVPCALGHFSTSAGLLNEAVRFKNDGITSNEIIDRVAKVLEEQNTLERVDLTSEKIQDSPEWERDIAEEALQQSRSLRHRLETIETIEELEQAAVDTTAYYRSLNREWWKRRFAKTGKTEPEMTLDEAKKMAAEEAAKEVEARWQSPMVAEQPPAVIPTEPRPRPRREPGLEYFADSSEHLAQTIDNTGCRQKLDNAFQEAIARIKGLK